MDAKLAEKYLKAYPNDLIEFDSLVSGEKKDLSKENSRLESENSAYLEKIEKLESENSALKDKEDPDIQALKDENQTLKDKIVDMEKDPEIDPKATAEPAKDKKE